MAKRFDRRRGAALVVLAAGAVLGTAPAPAAADTGKQSISGYLAVTGTASGRKQAGSAIVAKGVYDGVGRLVERPNHPGESDQYSRDDLVFPEGVIHIVNKSTHFSVKPDLRTCYFVVDVRQTTRIDGGTGKFANATGTFAGRVTGQALGRRTADGKCDQNRPPLFELDRIAGDGTMTL